MPLQKKRIVYIKEFLKKKKNKINPDYQLITIKPYFVFKYFT